MLFIAHKTCHMLHKNSFHMHPENFKKINITEFSVLVDKQTTIHKKKMTQEFQRGTIL